MDQIRKGDLRAWVAGTPAEVAAALALRARAFRSEGGAGETLDGGGRGDADAFDAVSLQVLIGRGDQVQATFRIRHFPRSDGITQGYAGQRYRLDRLAARGGAMAELGRFCTLPGLRDPDLVRMAWAAAAGLVEAWGAGFLFGCSSFAGTDPATEVAALGLLAARHLAPPDWAPGPRADEVFPIAALPPPADPQAALARLPALLRSYLGMGGRVSDHAVIDRDLGTFHLFTGLDIAAIPPARAAALRHLSR